MVVVERKTSPPKNFTQFLPSKSLSLMLLLSHKKSYSRIWIPTLTSTVRRTRNTEEEEEEEDDDSTSTDDDDLMVPRQSGRLATLSDFGLLRSGQ